MSTGMDKVPRIPDSLPNVPELIGYNVDTDRSLDNIVVLARNLNPNNTLTPTLKGRTAVALHLIASGAVEEVCCFSGGKDWRDAMTNTDRPPGGQAMLDYSNILASLYRRANKPLPDSVRRCAETTSNHTAENLVNSREKLELGPRSILGVLSDALHHRYGRPELLAKKVFGRRVTIVPIAFVEPAPLRAGIYEEIRNTIGTRALMTDIYRGRNGNPEKVMSRARQLEWIIAHLAQVGVLSMTEPKTSVSK
jgi:hypothetical protein